MCRQILHAGVRQFLHRMVVCMNEEILPFIPVAMENLLKSADARELHDFIPLLNQLVCKFKVRPTYIANYSDAQCMLVKEYMLWCIEIVTSSLLCMQARNVWKYV